MLLVALALLLSTAVAAPQDQAAVASLSKLISSLEDTLPVDSLEEIEEEDDMALGATGGSGGGDGSGGSGGSGGGGDGSWNPPVPSPEVPTFPDMVWNRFGPFAIAHPSCNDVSTPAQVSSWTSALDTYYGATTFLQFNSGCNAYDVNDVQYTPAHPFYTVFTFSALMKTGTMVPADKNPCTEIAKLNLTGLDLNSVPEHPCMEQAIGQAKQFSFNGEEATIVESDNTGVEVTVLLGNQVQLGLNQFLRVEILCVYQMASNLIEQRFMDCPRFVYFGRDVNGAGGAKSTAAASFMFHVKNTQFYDGTTPVSIIINPNSVEMIQLNAAGNGMDPNMFVSNCSGDDCGVCGLDGASCIASGTRMFDYTVDRQHQVFVVNVQDEDAYRTVRHPANWVPRCEPEMPNKIEIKNAGDTLANQVYIQSGSRGYYYCTYTGEMRGDWAVGIHSGGDLGAKFGRPETWQIWWNPSQTPEGGMLRYQSYSTRQDFAGLQGPWEPIDGFLNDRAPIIVHYIESSIFKLQGCLFVTGANSGFNGYYVIEDTMANFVNLIRYRLANSGVQFEKHIIIYQTPDGNNMNTGTWYMSMDGDFTPYYMTTTKTSADTLAKVTDPWAIGANAAIVGTSVPTVEVVTFQSYWINGMAAEMRASMSAAEAAADIAAEARHNAFCPARFIAPTLYFDEVCVEATGSSNQQVNQVYRLVPPQRDANGNDVPSSLTIYIGESFTAYALSMFELSAFNPSSGYWFLSYAGQTVYYTNKNALTPLGASAMSTITGTYQPFSTAVSGVVTVVDKMCPDKYA